MLAYYIFFFAEIRPSSTNLSGKPIKKAIGRWIVAVSGAVQGNGNKMHGLWRAKSYCHFVTVQPLCGLFDLCAQSTWVSVLPNPGCLHELGFKILAKNLTCYYHFQISPFFNKLKVKIIVINVIILPHWKIFQDFLGLLTTSASFYRQSRDECVIQKLFYTVYSHAFLKFLYTLCSLYSIF